MNHLNIENNVMELTQTEIFITTLCVDSLYYTESEFKEHFEFKQNGSSNFSLVHFNCRSIASNFD